MVCQAALLRVTIADGDGWEPTIGTDGAATAALLSALRSPQEGARGWNAIVHPALTFADVSAPANNSVSIRLPRLCDACTAYAIDAAETVRLVIPAPAVLSGTPIAAAGMVAINASAGEVAFGGSLTGNATERDVRDAAARELMLVLSGDTWAPELQPGSALAMQVIIDTASRRVAQRRASSRSIAQHSAASRSVAQRRAA